MFLEIAAGAYLLGSYAYHRWFDEDPPDDKPKEFKVPVTKPGAPVPLYFGRVRIRQPILVATAPEFFTADVDEWSFRQAGGSDSLFGLDMLFSCGIGFKDGVNKVHNMWAGDLKMRTPSGPGLEDLTGGGGYETPAYMAGPAVVDRDDNSAIDYPGGFGLVEFLNGNSEQEIVDKTGINLSKTYAGDRLSNIPYAWATPTLGEAPGTQYQFGGTTPPGAMSGHRGETLVFLFSGNWVAYAFDSGIALSADHGEPVVRWHHFPVVPTAGTTLPVLPWIVGASPEPPAYSFEQSSYPNTSLDLRTVGDEANPADCLWAIYRDTYGKLGLDYTRLDYETFRAAAEVLASEGHGYSRVWEGERPEAGEMVSDILKQTDGLIYEDPYDGLIKYRLIRADFDASSVLVIDPNNAKLEPVTAGGRSRLTNRMQIVFENRAKDYEDDDVTADNGANAVGQDGEVRLGIIEFRGVKTPALAAPLASRELGAHSIPLAKFRAIVDRTALRVVPGDRVVVNYPKWNISGMVMIVARAGKGPAGSNDIALDLVQDFHYTHRFIVSDDTGLPHHPYEALG